MPYETKKALRAKLAEKDGLLGEQRARAMKAEGYLKRFGYEEVDSDFNVVAPGVPYRVWRPDAIARELKKAEEEARLVDEEARQAEHRKAINTAVDNTRRAVLRTVIDALGLTTYDTTGHYRGVFDTRQDAEIKQSDADRFWSDITTALEVREEQKREETRAKTAARVAGLRQKAEPSANARYVIGLSSDPGPVVGSYGTSTLDAPSRAFIEDTVQKVRDEAKKAKKKGKEAS